jgi:hypothetical protein
LIAPTFKIRPFDLCFLVVAAISFIFLFRGSIQAGPFTYDESDYMSAAHKGIVENYRETSSMNLAEFASTGMKAVHGQLKSVGLSEFIRGRRDLTFFRHYHGPFYFDWLAFTSRITHANEALERFSGWTFHLLTFATIYLGLFWLFGDVYRPAACVASLVYLFTANNIFTVDELSSHVPFIWFSIATLVVIGRLVVTRSLRWYYAALACCTLSFCDLEYGVLLGASLLVAVWLVRKELFAGWRPADAARWLGWSALLIVGILLALWPAGLFKGTLIEGFIYIVYLSRFRSNAFGNTTPLESWQEHFALSPFDFTIFFLCFSVALVGIWRSRHRNVLLPILTYATLLFLSTLKNTATAPRYISSLFAPVYFVAAVILFDRLRRVPSAIALFGSAALAVALAISSWRITVLPVLQPRPPSDAQLLISFMREHQRNSYIVPWGFLPTLEYYFPDTSIRSLRPGESFQDLAAGGHTYFCGFGVSAPNVVFSTGLKTPTGELACVER